MKWVRMWSDSSLWRLSAQGAIMAQVLCFCLLMLPVVGYSMWSEWHNEQTMQRSQLLHTVKSLAARQTALVRGTESLLLALSLAPLVRHGDPDKVFPFLVRFDQVQQDYTGIALFRLDGSSVVSLLNGKVRSVAQEIIQKRPYFQQGVAQNGFSVGLSLALEDGRLVLPMTMPVSAEDGTMHFILMLPLSLDRQHEVLDAILKQSREQVIFFDGEYKSIFEHPSSGGQVFSPEFVSGTLAPQGFRYTEGCTNEPLFTFSTPDGRECIGVMAMLYHEDAAQPYLSVLAFDEQLSWTVFLRQRHVLQLVGLTVVTFLLLYTSSWVGRRYFVDGLGSMAEVALKTGAGTGDARCGDLPGCREILITGNALDRMLDSLQADAEKLRILSTHDPLTGLWNRRQLNEVAGQELSAALRYGYPVSLAMADIDHFKMINDTYGHAGGDAVLQCLARVFREHIRAADIVARFGGEEFVFLFPHTAEDRAVAALEALRRLCGETEVPYQGATIRFSVSFGVAALPPDAEEASDVLLDKLIRRADAALYASKEQGRNRVTPASALEG